MSKVRSRKWKNILIALTTVTLLAGCSAEAGSEDEMGIKVETTKIALGKLEEHRIISSTVSADKEVQVIPKVSGTVKKVNFKLGDEVKAGDILFEIDQSDVLIQVDSARAGVQTAEAAVNSAIANKNMNSGSNMDIQISQMESSLETAKLNYKDLKDNLERTKILYDSGAVSKKELETMQLNVDVAKQNVQSLEEKLSITKNELLNDTKRVSQSAVSQAEASKKQAEASLKNAEKQLSNTNVKAEIDGIISSSSVTEGMTISAGNPTMSIVDINKVKLDFQVSDSYINKLQVGAKAYIEIDGLDNKVFEGVVSNIAPSANKETLLYPVEIYIDNMDKTIRPGMFAKIRLVVEEKENVISVPLDVVLERNGEKFVFIVQENKAIRKTVNTGIENDKNIEITEGLKVGDVVVTSGQDFLSDGSKVEI